MSFGEILRNLRLEKRISQRDLADRVGLNFTYISKIENGVMEAPSEAAIVKIAKVLEADSDVLLAAAGKVSSDILKIIQENPQLPAVLRLLSENKLTPEDLYRLFRPID